MNIVGNIILDDKDYLEKLNNLISKYDLKSSLLFLLMNLCKIKYIYLTSKQPFVISIVKAMNAGLSTYKIQYRRHKVCSFNLPRPITRSYNRNYCQFNKK